MAVFALARTILYLILLVSSVLTFILSAAFIGRSISDYGVYSEAGAELLATGLLASIVLPILVFLFHRRQSTSILGSLAVELGVVGVLWLLYLGGAAALSSGGFGTSNFCTLSICSLARAVQAFAWISWITLTLLLALLLTGGVIAHRRDGPGAWTAPFALEGGVGAKRTPTTTTGAPAATTATPNATATTTNATPVAMAQV